MKLASEGIPRSLHRSLASQAEKGEKQKRMCARHEGKDSVRDLLEERASFTNQRAVDLQKVLRGEVVAFARSQDQIGGILTRLIYGKM